MLNERYEFRSIHADEADQAALIEQICFPPNEACTPDMMAQRVQGAPELFLVAVDRRTGRIAGFLNGLSTKEHTFRDEYFTDVRLFDPEGDCVMLLGLDVLPEHRRQGLARELVRRYAEREHANGRRFLLLTCLEEKVGMYAGFGFRDLGAANSTWGGEAWHEMSLTLDGTPDWRLDKLRMVDRFRKENRTAAKGQVVFAGSSLMEMFPVEDWGRELGPDAPQVCNRGVGGWRTEDMLAHLDVCVTDLSPRWLFLNIGTNDLSDTSVTIDALIGRYDRILTQIEAAVPGIEILLMAYYPVNYDAADDDMKACLRIRTNERIREANDAVRDLAQRRHHRFLDFNAPLTDDQGRLRAEYTIEGMHIRPEGYRAIWPEVRRRLQNFPRLIDK